MDVDTVADVSEAHAATIFKVEVSGVGTPFSNGFWCIPSPKEGCFIFFPCPLLLFAWTGHSSHPSTYWSIGQILA
jgi:hypothetical protein